MGRGVVLGSIAALLLAVPAMLNAAGATAGADTAPRPLRETVASYLENHGCPPALTVVVVAALPIVELRGAIPVGINLFQLDWRLVYVLAVIGNILPIPLILLLLGPLSRGCMRFKYGRLFFTWLFARTRAKSAQIEKYETLGLTIFVAVPLPATGAWTGAMAAFLLGLTFPHAMLSILLGVMIAGAIMTVLSLMGWLGALVAGIALIGLAVVSLGGWLNREAKVHT
jgi:uncharacterized membrane protein